MTTGSASSLDRASRPPSVDTKAIFNAYSFDGQTADGQNPYAGAFFDESLGILLGTTQDGGRYGFGMVYQLIDGSSTDGLVYSFGSKANDGLAPKGALIEYPPDSAFFFGTTTHGGSSTACTNGCGTVFRLMLQDTHSPEEIVYSFAGSPDGAQPAAGVVADKSGNLYGVTNSGGANDLGTVFKLARSGSTYTEKATYSFRGAPLDGANPVGALLVQDGKLYGTTENGGKYNKGTVFEISTDLTGEQLVASLGQNGTAAHPLGNLIADSTGTLYGTASRGGNPACRGGGCGVVFSIAPGTLQVTDLHTFGGPPKDGAVPWTGLLLWNGALYGTTAEGGNGQCLDNKDGVDGCGTLFRLGLTVPGYKILGNFDGVKGTLGSHPYGDLTVDDTGTLYGTTSRGGSSAGPCLAGEGCGTVFGYVVGTGEYRSR
jgi:uncharacterized repeat protein (TIGR03803 family)